MDIEEVRERIAGIFNPEPDEDMEPRELAHPTLKKRYGFDTSYLETFAWEGSTMHPDTHACSATDDNLHTLTRNSDVSTRLFVAGLRLFADSIVAYHGNKERKGQLRFYPPVILTFWSGFETFVRYSSELMLIAVPEVPTPIANYLRDLEAVVDRRGEVKVRDRFQSVLDRYAVLLKYGYGFGVDRGSTHWQRLEEAKDLRDYYTHLDVTDPRAVAASDVLRFLESVLLGIIHPSVELRRTLLLGVYHLYNTWAEMSELVDVYTEQPFFKDWFLKESYLFHCNFKNIDTSRFPVSGNRVKGQGTS